MFYTNCAIGINPSYLKGHLAKHFLRILNKERNQAISKAISIVQLLEVSSLSLSLGAINALAAIYTLKPFLELRVLENLLQCSFCPFVVFSKTYIKKHLDEEHKEELLSAKGLDLANSYKVIAKGQSLEKARYFF